MPSGQKEQQGQTLRLASVGGSGEHGRRRVLSGGQAAGHLVLFAVETPCLWQGSHKIRSVAFSGCRDSLVPGREQGAHQGRRLGQQCSKQGLERAGEDEQGQWVAAGCARGPRRLGLLRPGAWGQREAVKAEGDVVRGMRMRNSVLDSSVG